MMKPSDSSADRRDATTALVETIKSASSSVTSDLLVEWATHLSRRLSDWACVDPAVMGLSLLFDKFDLHALEFPREEHSVVAKERLDLSLFIGMADVSELPEGNSSVAQKVLTKLLINVHAPSFGQAVRKNVLELFRVWITKNYFTDLEEFRNVFVKGLSIQGDDERDPVCLGLLFECILGLDGAGLLTPESSLSSSVVDDLFQCFSSYFPIKIWRRDLDNIDMENLKKSMTKCFTCFGLRAVEFLVPQLNDPENAEDAIVVLTEMVQQEMVVSEDKVVEYSVVSPSSSVTETLVAILLPELEGDVSGGKLIFVLWQFVVRALARTNVGLLKQLIAKFVKERSNFLLVLTAQASESVFGLVVEACADNSLDVLVCVVNPVMTGPPFEHEDEYRIDPATASKLIELLAAKNLLSCVNPKFISNYLVPFIEETRTLLVVWSWVMKGSHFPTIVQMFEFHYEFAISKVEGDDRMQQLLTRMERNDTIVENAGDVTVPRILVILDRHTYPLLSQVVNSLRWTESWLEKSNWVTPTLRGGRTDFPEFCRFFHKWYHLVEERNSLVLSEGFQAHLVDSLEGEAKRRLLKEILRHAACENVPFRYGLGAISGVSSDLLEPVLVELNLPYDQVNQLVNASLVLENACKIFALLIVDVWKLNSELYFPSEFAISPETWAAGISALVESFPEHRGTLVSLIAEQNSPAHIERLFSGSFLTPALEKLVPFILSVIDSRNNVPIVVRLLANVSADTFVQAMDEDPSLRDLLMTQITVDVAHLKLVMKSLILTEEQQISHAQIEVLINQVVDLLLIDVGSSTPYFRFACVQLLGLAPEIVPSGKLVKLKKAVLKCMHSLLNKEPKQIVRKQIAVTITGWLNLQTSSS